MNNQLPLKARCLTGAESEEGFQTRKQEEAEEVKEVKEVKEVMANFAVVLRLSLLCSLILRYSIAIYKNIWLTLQF